MVKLSASMGKDLTQQIERVIEQSIPKELHIPIVPTTEEERTLNNLYNMVERLNIQYEKVLFVLGKIELELVKQNAQTWYGHTFGNLEKN